jgi:hypothetical protein
VRILRASCISSNALRAIPASSIPNGVQGVAGGAAGPCSIQPISEWIGEWLDCDIL